MNFERAPHFLSLLLGTTALVGLAAFPSLALAAEAWTGTVSTDWYTAGNWSGAVPDNTTAVTIDTTSPHPTVISGGTASGLSVVAGHTGTGSLTITNGAILSDQTATLGELAGSNGYVTVTGPGSEWNSSGDLYVGYNGYGELEVLNGASVTDDIAQVGALAGSSGAVKVDGAGSTWTNAGGMVVGQAGYGTLLISGGGLVKATSATLGGVASGHGIATVTGAGSSLSMTGGGLVVGYLGRGELSILDGATVSMSSTDVGSEAGSTGSVVIDGAGSALNASFHAFVGDKGDGTITLSNGGTLATDTLLLGKETGSSGRLIIGADVGEAAVAAGYFTAVSYPVPYLVFGDGDGTLVLNHTSDHYDLDAILSGDGEIDHVAGTTYLTTDADSFVGFADVTGGKLVVNADYSDATMIASLGGILGGSGTIGNLQVKNGGIVTPGNSIGTLHVDNTVTFTTDSIYQAEVNAAGVSDLIDAGGVATITGGTVQALAAAGQYAPSTQYTIVTAAGGVNGTYTDVTVNSAFLAASLSYDVNDVFLTLDRINTTMFNDAGQTPNQKATGAGLDSIAVGNVIAENLALQSDSAKRAALDQLSGELHGSLKSAELEDSRFVREAINGRLLDTDSSGVWSHGYGSFGSLEGDGNAAGLDRQTGGLFVGADGAITDGWRFGLLGGYSLGNYDVSERGSSASADSYNAAVYSSFAAGGLSFRLGADYAVHQVETDRTIAFAGFSDEDIASYASQTGQVFGEVGYKIEAGPASFEPYAAVAYVSQSTDGFSETGGASALTAEADVLAATFTTLGVRAEAKVDLGDATGTLRGSLGWRHAFGDPAPTSTMSFAGGDLFTIAGVPVAEDAAVVDLGFDVVSAGATFGASYSGVISEAGYDSGAKAHLGWQF